MTSIRNIRSNTQCFFMYYISIRTDNVAAALSKRFSQDMFSRQLGPSLNNFAKIQAKLS